MSGPRVCLFHLQPSVVFLNKARSDSLAEESAVRVVYGFNGWETGSHPADMVLAPNFPDEVKPSNWCCAPVQVPLDAYEMNLAFCNKEGSVWDK